MPRMNQVKAARKDQGKCCACGKALLKGHPYKWAKPRYGGKAKACTLCTIPQSLLSSSKMVAVWDAQEALVKDIQGADPDDVAGALRSLAEEARNVGEEYQDSCDRQREFFPDASQAEENEEKAQGLSDWADSLESAADDIEGLQSEADAIRLQADELDPNAEDYDGSKEVLAADLADKLEEAQDKATEASEECPE